MATANHLDDNFTVSGEAVDLLDSLAAELDAVILGLSKEIAKDRIGDPQVGTAVEVEAQDVQAAALVVVSNLREQIAEGKLPSHMKRLPSARNRDAFKRAGHIFLLPEAIAASQTVGESCRSQKKVGLYSG